MKNRYTLICILALIAGLGTGTALAAEAPPAGSTIQTAAKAVPAGPAENVDRIEIRVGNEIITTLDIEEPLTQLRARFSQELRGEELEKKMEEIRGLHLKRLVESKLLLLEARKQEIEVGDAVVDEQADKEMETLRAQFNSSQAFKAQMAKEHLTEAEFKAYRKKLVRENLLRQRLLQMKMQELKTGAEVTNEQLRDYYEKHRQEFLRPTRVRLRQVYVARPDVSLPSDEFALRNRQALAKIRAAREQIRGGKSFETVAKNYSEHAATRERGGDIGWIEEGDVGLPEFERAVFKQLKLGRVSGVIDTARGYFVVKLEDRQAGGVAPYDEVQGMIRKKIMAEGSEKRYDIWIKTLKKKFKVAYIDKKS